MRLLGVEPRISRPQREVLTTILQTPGEVGYRSLYLPHAKRALHHLSYIPIPYYTPFCHVSIVTSLLLGHHFFHRQATTWHDSILHISQFALVLIQRSIHHFQHSSSHPKYDLLFNISTCIESGFISTCTLLHRHPLTLHTQYWMCWPTSICVGVRSCSYDQASSSVSWSLTPNNETPMSPILMSNIPSWVPHWHYYLWKCSAAHATWICI